MKNITINCEDYIGLTLDDAIKLAKNNNLRYRIIKKDDINYPITCDLHLYRLNFTIKNNIIIECDLG